MLDPPRILAVDSPPDSGFLGIVGRHGQRPLTSAIYGREGSVSPGTIRSGIVAARGGCESRPRSPIQPMNIHHLELFYYVARHGGISRAARLMPYGIQQPAISGQVRLLEQDLGVRLFERTPFQLTKEGAELYAFAQSFFDRIDLVATQLRGREVPRLRIAASEIVLRDHLPPIATGLRQRHPGLQLVLRSGFQAEMQAWLMEREVDFAVSVLESRPPARMRHVTLARLPLLLLVPKRCRAASAAEVLAGNPVTEPLISLPETETVSRLFQKGLRQRGVDWPPSLVASSLDVVERYVANGYGVGVTVATPGARQQNGVRALALAEFPTIEVAALWMSDPTPLVNDAITEVKRYAATLPGGLSP